VSNSQLNSVSIVTTCFFTLSVLYLSYTSQPSPGGPLSLHTVCKSFEKKKGIFFLHVGWIAVFGVGFIFGLSNHLSCFTVENFSSNKSLMAHTFT